MSLIKNFAASTHRVVHQSYVVMAVLLCISTSLSAQTVVSQQVLATDLANPWSIALLPNNEFLVSERPGQLAKISADGSVTRLSGLPNVVAERQGGVLGVALDPEFTNNQKIYVCLVGADSKGNTGSEVYQATLKASSLTKVSRIFAAQPKIKSGFHFGCRLAFANDGALFITLGDRYSQMDKTQSLDNHHGKVIRVLSNGTPHPNNPFLDSAVPEVYSIGHRNVQGIALHPTRNVMWAHEHGPKGGDELNVLKAGANYGWPTITYGINYNGDIISDKTEAAGLEQPLTYWVPSIAPSGMAFYKGDLLVGSLKFRHLRYLTLQDNQVVRQTELLTELNARIRDVAVGTDDTIYVVTDEPKGRLIALRLQP